MEISISGRYGASLARTSTGRSNEIHDKGLDIDTMYYDRHSEVEFAAISRLPRLKWAKR